MKEIGFLIYVDRESKLEKTFLVYLITNFVKSDVIYKLKIISRSQQFPYGYVFGSSKQIVNNFYLRHYHRI